jgi:hypothetical protein
MPAITFDEAMGLIRRFAALEKFPFYAEGESLLAETLQESTVNMEHAREVCREFTAECPKPADIRNVAFNSRAKFQTDAPVCPKCQGSGWMSVTRRINGQEFSAAAPCSCRGNAPPVPQPPPSPRPPKKPLASVRDIQAARKGGSLFE